MRARKPGIACMDELKEAGMRTGKRAVEDLAITITRSIHPPGRRASQARFALHPVPRQHCKCINKNINIIQM